MYLQLRAKPEGVQIVVDVMSKKTPLVIPREDVSPKWFFGGRTWMRASGDATGGSYTLIEQVAAPGTGSPYHVHHNEDESFFVLAGSIRFVSGDQSWVGGPGTWAFLPRDIPHGFEVVGETDAHILLMTNPGGFDQFVMGLWTDEPGPPDMEKVMQDSARFGLEILGPLPQ